MKNHGSMPGDSIDALRRDFPTFFGAPDTRINIRPGWVPLLRYLGSIAEPLAASFAVKGDDETGLRLLRAAHIQGMLIVTVPGVTSPNILKAIEDIEKAAESTCEICGSSGSLHIGSETLTACQEHAPGKRPDPFKRKTTSLDLLNLSRDVADHLRRSVGDAPYPMPSSELDALSSNGNAADVLVPMTALMYGAVRSFNILMEAGQEREALQMRRLVMEYYFYARYYADNPIWATIAWFRALYEQKVDLEAVIDERGSRTRLRQLRKLSRVWETFEKQIPKADKQHIRPSIEVLAKQYALSEVDYASYYRGSSQLTHATFAGLAFGWDGSDRYRLRFDGAIHDANVSLALVVDYLLAFIDAIGRHVIFAEPPDTSPFHSRLKQLRRQLHLRRIARRRY